MLKKKKTNLGPNLPYLDIFGHEFERAFVIFEVSTLKLVKMQSFMLKKEYKFETKIAFLWYFWARLWKNYLEKLLQKR